MTESPQNSSRKKLLFSPTVDLQASQKVSSVNLSMRLVLPTPREPMIIICSLKSAGLGGIFLRRDWAPRAGEEFAEPPLPPAALRGMSNLGSISNPTSVILRQKRAEDGISNQRSAAALLLLLMRGKVWWSPTVDGQPLETGAVVTSHPVPVPLCFPLCVLGTEAPAKLLLARSDQCVDQEWKTRIWRVKKNFIFTGLLSCRRVLWKTAL